MSGTEIAQIITSLATLLGVATTALLSLRNARKIEEVHKATNGMSQKIEAAARAQGQSEGRDEERKHPTP